MIALAERETVEPEKELTPEIIAQFQQRATQENKEPIFSGAAKPRH